MEKMDLQSLNMDFSVGSLLAGLLFGTLGIYFFRLGKREMNFRLMGVASMLFLYSYFIYNPYLCWGIGIVLTVLSFKLV